MESVAAKKESKPKAEKPAAKKAPAAPASEKKATAPKKAPSGATLKVTQMVGSIARRWDQQATLKGLGLNKRHRSRVLQDTPEIRGMIRKVQHLIKVE